MDFSVIVPFYNRLEALAECLDSLARLGYPPDRFEAILVDDGGEERADHLVSGYRDRLCVRLLRQAHAGPAAARNLGASHAGGAWLAFTDSDCMPAEDWLDRLAAALGAAEGSAVGGRVVNTLPSVFSIASQWQSDYLISYSGAASGRTAFFTTNNFALPRESFFASGGFDTNYRQPGGEDREFCRRWVRQGRRLCWAPEAVVRHAHRLTWGDFCRQHFHYGRGAWRYWSSQKKANRFPPEQPGLYLDLILKPLAMRPLRRGVAVACLQAASQAATATGYVFEALRARRGK
jgi:glycosyltransferase involved in cell wall biosynthesis